MTSEVYLLLAKAPGCMRGGMEGSSLVGRAGAARLGIEGAGLFGNGGTAIGAAGVGCRGTRGT